MLILTEAAVEAVKSVTSTTPAQDRTGVRITTAVPEPAEPAALELTTADGPGTGDQVIEAAGALVFVEPQAAAYLDDKVLDARVDEQGRAHFLLGDQLAS